MIYFKDITIEGFGSIIDKLTFPLDKEGLNIISGKVGSGKTSIPSALVWCLYGTTLKGKASVATWEELRTNSFKGTKVEVTFLIGKDEYTIIRCLEYKLNVKEVRGSNNIFIIKNGLITSTSGKVQQQAEIEKLIGYSFDLFTNAIIFGQRMKRIIDETGPNKKKIFEEAFEVTFIEEARLKVKDQDADLEKLASKYYSRMSTLGDRIDDLTVSHNTAVEYEQMFSDHKEKRIAELKKSIASYKEAEIKVKASDLTKALKDLEEAEVYEKHMALIAKLEGEEGELLEEQKSAKAGKCKYCGSTISGQKQIVLNKQITDKLHRLNLQLTELREKQWLFPKVFVVKTEEKNVERIKQELKLKSAQSKNKEAVLEMKEELASIKKEKLVIRSEGIRKKIELAKKKAVRAKAKYETIKGNREINKWLINDALSNSGLKAYIFNSLLARVNKKLNDYSHIIGFKIEFGIDMKSARKDFYQVIYKDGIVAMYQDLSGGQKQLVDTCIALAINHTIGDVRPSNLLFLDEPFEGLDDETIEIVSDLIVNSSQNKCLYLITHHSSFSPITSNKIFFTLDQKGNTKVL